MRAVFLPVGSKSQFIGMTHLQNVGLNRIRVEQNQLITVYIPTHNRAHCLREALTSLRLQTLAKNRFRVIVADNASPDDTPMVVREFPDLNIVYLRHQTNVGAVNNWNGATDFFDTTYFHYLSDDDLLAPTHLEYALLRMEQMPEIGLFAAGSQYGKGLWEDELNRADLRLGDRYLNKEDMCCHWSGAAWLAAHSIASAVCSNASLFRTSVLRKIIPLFDSQILELSDRWLMAQVGAITQCVTTPWPACTLRELGNNVVHGNIGDHQMRQLAKIVAARVLKLAEEREYDIVGFWQNYFSAKNKQREDIKYLISNYYPECTAQQILGGWKPRQGRIDRLWLPDFAKQQLRNIKNSIGA